MVNLREFMLRLRPAGAPGAAARVAVPADRRRGAEEELEPVFAALAPVIASAQRIKAEGAAAAARELAQGQARAQSVLAQSSGDAAATRAGTAAALRAETASSVQAQIQQAQATAKDLLSAAQASQDEQTEHVLQGIRAELEELCRTT